MMPVKYKLIAGETWRPSREKGIMPVPYRKILHSDSKDVKYSIQMNNFTYQMQCTHATFVHWIIKYKASVN